MGADVEDELAGLIRARQLDQAATRALEAYGGRLLAGRRRPMERFGVVQARLQRANVAVSTRTSCCSALPPLPLESPHR